MIKSERRGTLATFHNKGRCSPLPSCSPDGAASLARASHNRQNVEEYIDDVSVEVEGSENVFLWTQGQLLVAQEKLSVNSQKLHREKMELAHFHSLYDVYSSLSLVSFLLYYKFLSL